MLGETALVEAMAGRGKGTHNVKGKGKGVTLGFIADDGSFETGLARFADAVAMMRTYLDDAIPYYNNILEITEQFDSNGFAGEFNMHGIEHALYMGRVNQEYAVRMLPLLENYKVQLRLRLWGIPPFQKKNFTHDCN